MKDALQILFVEDNPGDIRLAKIALERSGLLAECFYVTDGEQALKFLQERRRSENQELPDLIMLDLNLPCIDGREVLLSMKQDPDLKSIPVIVLTSSDREVDIDWAYQLKASGYFCKPVSIQGFERIIKQVIQYWPDYSLCCEDAHYRPPRRSFKGGPVR